MGFEVVGAALLDAGAAEAGAGAVAAADVGAGLAAADVGAGLAAADAGAGLAAADAGAGAGLAAGSTAAELVAAGLPEIAAPLEAGLGATVGEAGALAPAASALAPAASPAVAGLGSVAGEALPGAIAEGAGVTPLTETALDLSLPASTQGVEQLGTQAATQGVEQLGTQAATQGVEQLGTQAATQAATQTAETGLSQLAPGAQQVLNDAAPLSSEAGTQLAQAAPETLAPPTAPPIEAPPAPPIEAPPAPPAPTAPPDVQPMNPPVSPVQPGADTAFSKYLAQAQNPLIENAPASAAPLAPAQSLSNLVGNAPSLASSMAAEGTTLSDLATVAGEAGGEGLTGSISNIAGKAGDWLAKNPTAVLSGLGLAYNVMRGQQTPKYSAEMQAQAAALQAQGAQLQGYLNSGTLPPGIGAALSGAHDSAASAIRSRYANMGMSGSSAEMQDLNNLAQTTVSQGADIANKLLATGVSEQQFASGLYQNLMATSMQQDTNMSNAIAGFTNAMAKATPASAGSTKT